MNQIRPGFLSGTKLNEYKLDNVLNLLDSSNPNVVSHVNAIASIQYPVAPLDAIHQVGLAHFNTPIVVSSSTISISGYLLTQGSTGGFLEGESLNNAITLVAMTKDWDPTTVCWNNQPDTQGLSKQIIWHSDMRGRNLTPPLPDPPGETWEPGTYTFYHPFEIDLLPTGLEGLDVPPLPYVETTYFGIAIYPRVGDIPRNYSFSGVLFLNVLYFSNFAGSAPRIGEDARLDWDRIIL